MIDERVGMALSGLSSCASAALGSRYRFGTQETTDADGGDALPSTAEGATVLEGQFLWCVSKGWYTPHRGRVPAQRGLLRTYLKYEVVIEIELGRTKYYPAFQFRGGKVIDALAEINKHTRHLLRGCASDTRRHCAAGLVADAASRPSENAEGSDQKPLDLLDSVSEQEFEAAVHEAEAMSAIVVPDGRRSV
jgi:hypothetical protein